MDSQLAQLKLQLANKDREMQAQTRLPRETTSFAILQIQ